MSDMQHINLEEYSPDRYICLCSLSVCLYSRPIIVYRICHCSLDCSLQRLFLFLPRLSLFSVTSLFSFPRLFSISLFSIDNVWLCSLQRLSRFSIASVIVLYRVCLCALDLFCVFFLGALWKLKCACIVLTVILQFFDCDICCWVDYL